MFGRTAHAAGIDMSMRAKCSALNTAVRERFFATLNEELTRCAVAASPLAHTSQTIKE